MNAEFRGRRYSYLIGSDVERDGMYLELSDVTEETADVLEVFYSDQTGAMTVTTFCENIAFEAVEWALDQARSRLLPATD